MCTWAQEPGGELSRVRDAFAARRGRGGPEPTRVSVLTRVWRAELATGAPGAGGCGCAGARRGAGFGPAAEGLRRRRFYLRSPELRAISERLRAPARPGRRSAAAAGGGGSEEGVKPVAAASGSGRRGLRRSGTGRRGLAEQAAAGGGTDELAAAAGLLGMERSRVTRM